MLELNEFRLNEILKFQHGDNVGKWWDGARVTHQIEFTCKLLAGGDNFFHFSRIAGLKNKNVSKFTSFWSLVRIFLDERTTR